MICLCGQVSNQVLAQASSPSVDLALVLAIDVSYSVDDLEFRQQRDATAGAFRLNNIQDAITGGAVGAIAVTVVLWSRTDLQQTLIPWMILSNKAAIDHFAGQLAQSQRLLKPGGTSISGAIEYSLKALTACPCNPLKTVIDISADGRDSFSYRLDRWRQLADAYDVTINGLAILNEIPTLDRYFERNVITGPAAFVERANNYGAYADAIERKLLRELQSQYSMVPPLMDQSMER